jgi:hypothetical protein
MPPSSGSGTINQHEAGSRQTSTCHFLHVNYLFSLFFDPENASISAFKMSRNTKRLQGVTSQSTTASVTTVYISTIQMYIYVACSDAKLTEQPQIS